MTSSSNRHLHHDQWRILAWTRIISSETELHYECFEPNSGQPFNEDYYWIIANALDNLDSHHGNGITAHIGNDRIRTFFEEVVAQPAGTLSKQQPAILTRENFRIEPPNSPANPTEVTIHAFIF